MFKTETSGGEVALQFGSSDVIVPNGPQHLFSFFQFGARGDIRAPPACEQKSFDEVAKKKDRLDQPNPLAAMFLEELQPAAMKFNDTVSRPYRGLLQIIVHNFI